MRFRRSHRPFNRRRRGVGRRPFRGPRPPFPGRRRRPRPPIDEALLDQLHRAHDLFAAGQNEEAGHLFARLADEAQKRQMPRQAAHLSLRAAQSFGRAGQGQQAVHYAQQGLDMMIDHGHLEKAAWAWQRAITGLRQHQLTAEAAALERAYAAQLSQIDLAESTPTKGRLPTQCPQCAAPVRSDEAEWIDQMSAACAYCGSVLQTE